MRILLEAVLDKIEKEMGRLYWNKNQKEMESPFRNTAQKYLNDTFEVRSYYWGDNEDEGVLPNFKYKDLSAYWYKHCERGLSWTYKGVKNATIPSEFLDEMIEDCVKSLEKDWNII